MKKHDKFMRLAIAEAKKATNEGEVPVGAVVVENGKVISACYNKRETFSDPTAHAELLALKEAAQRKGDWRFDKCTIYVTLEPCPMCAGALLMARMGKIVFGAFDKMQGCCGSVYLLPMDEKLSGQCDCVGGVMEHECKMLLTSFFQNKR